MSNIAVIGKNFGDEGKGLAVASICKQFPHSLIIKHNGGAQAGHTVEIEPGKRFIHHQIGSGAEYGAPTLLADSFFIDLYQLGREVEEFTSLYGFLPDIYALRNAFVTTIDDVFLNMGAESSRGENRHGSCGMGINECLQRINAGYGITLEDVLSHDALWIYERLNTIRKEYSIIRAESLNIGADNEYFALLSDAKVLEGFSLAIKDNVKFVTPVDAEREWLLSFDNLIFESGQGLLLDTDYEAYAPYLTPSKTGIANPKAFLEKRGMTIEEAIYVTRSYVTRHGEGPLPFEVSPEKIEGLTRDLTNEPNQWQGTIRYATHGDLSSFTEAIMEDISNNAICGCNSIKTSIMITHLDETKGLLYFADGTKNIDEVRKNLLKKIDRVYCSYSRYPDFLI